MLEKIKQQLFGIKTVVGIEVKILPDGTNTYNYTILQSNKGSIAVSDKGKQTNDFQELKELPKDSAISLSIIGKGILYKKLEGTVVSDHDKLIQTVMPNTNSKDFYIQYNLSDQSKHIHIARCSFVDALLLSFKDAGYMVIDVTLGPSALQSLIPFLYPDLQNEEISLAGYTFDYKKAQWESYKTLGNIDTSSFITLGDEKIDQASILKYATAFQIFTGTVLSSNIVSVANAKEEYLQKQIFTKAGWTILIFFLVALMINFFLFNHFTQKYNELSATQQFNENLLTRLNGLEVKLQEKEKFINRSGWHEPSKISYYMDRIAVTVPAAVLLTELSVNPVDVRKLKEQKIIEFTSGTVKIAGTCSRSLELNSWIKNLTELAFISKVDVKNYTHDEFENIGKFEIEMELKP